ncbi:MAG: PHP domain-containing protein [Clostridia bacterium]|nr:PHP domain-containing protein [Clostridia bacterium]
MKKHLIPKGGTFYRANLHSHTNISDGCLSPEEMKKIYKDKGYSILAYTDHDYFIPHNDLTDKDFLALSGFELQYNENSTYPLKRDLKSSHFCFIAKSPDMTLHPDFNEKAACISLTGITKDDINYDKSVEQKERTHTSLCINESVKKARDAGFFVTYNHPDWSLDNFNDYMEFEGMHAMEIFNYGCDVIGYNAYVPGIYDDILRSGKKIFAIASDDNHNGGDNPADDSFGGFTMIKAKSLDYEEVTDALFKGNFYASQGPEIYELFIEDGFVNVKCSDVKRITLTTNHRSARILDARGTEFLNSAKFPVDEDDVYIRITIRDSEGKCANTNAYFLEDIL